MEVCGGVWRWGIMDVGECGGDGVRRWEMEEFGSRGVKVREVEVKECEAAELAEDWFQGLSKG